MTIKGSLLLSVLIVKPFSAENCPTKIGPENGGFSQKWGSKYYFLFSKPPNGTSLRGTASFWMDGHKAADAGEEQRRRTTNVVITFVALAVYLYVLQYVLRNFTSRLNQCTDLLPYGAERLCCCSVAALTVTSLTSSLLWQITTYTRRTHCLRCCDCGCWTLVQLQPVSLSTDCSFVGKHFIS